VNLLTSNPMDTPDPNPADPDSDAALMALARVDDRHAFAVLVRRHQKMLLNFFIRSGVQYDAEDLVQQTFLRLYRYRDRYLPRAKFTTFLFLMARQVWIDELRRRSRTGRLADALAREPEPPNAAGGPPPERGGLDIADAVAALPEAMRQVVELGVYQDLPYTEVAHILGVPEGTVKSRMFNAIRMLRERLEVGRA
jgi:RNA polymerase sigma-70 factor, ECF subfamily